MRKYKYVGSNELIELVGKSKSRKLIEKPNDILQWLRENNQKPDRLNEITVTFVITTDENLWIADRHSEHIVCANGGMVFAAGEMTFYIDKDEISVVGVTNQSTGFCPEPDSWGAVANALDKASIERPLDYTEKFIFRHCENCEMVNIIKDNYFVCAVCSCLLNENCNFE